MALVSSDADEVVALRWDDGAFVVDPASRVRRPERVIRGGVESSPSGLRRLGNEEHPQAITLEEWHRAQAADAA